MLHQCSHLVIDGATPIFGSHCSCPTVVRFLNSTLCNGSPSSTPPLATIMFSGLAKLVSKPPLKPKKSKSLVACPGSKRSNLNNAVTSSLSTSFNLFVPSSNLPPSSLLPVASWPQSSPSHYSLPLLAASEILNSISPPNPNLPSQFLSHISLPSTPFRPLPILFLEPLYP
ncbi:hypothetical protein AMTRI_Chr11g96080 [Amborella trichopoda]